ncbi:MAG: PLP-dependent transferase [Rubrivivax sp.]
METPANPLWTVTDIADAAAAAHAAGALLAVDSTVATPVLTQPLVLGADIVMPRRRRVPQRPQRPPSPACSWRARTAPIGRQCERYARSWGALGSFRPGCCSAACARCRCGCVRPVLRPNESRRISPRSIHVSEVLYPGLPGAAGHEVAKRQMKGGFGGMLSIRVRGGEAAAIATAANVQLWKRATSLGGTESLVEHRASVEGAGTPAPADLLRLSVGLEHADDLIADLEQALARARA